MRRFRSIRTRCPNFFRAAHWFGRKRTVRHVSLLWSRRQVGARHAHGCCRSRFCRMSYPWLVHSRPERPQKALTYSAQRGRIYGHARSQIWSEEISIQERRSVSSSVLDFSCPLDQDEWIASMRGELQKRRPVAAPFLISYQIPLSSQSCAMNSVRRCSVSAPERCSRAIVNQSCHRSACASIQA